MILFKLTSKIKQAKKTEFAKIKTKTKPES